MSAHAILSASGAKRWLACPPSALLEQQFLETTSDYAEEGTLAHSYAELELHRWLGEVTPSAYKRRRNKIKKDAHYSPEMDDYIEAYTAEVIERINTARAQTADAVILLEQRLDFSAWVPEGFGTGDVVIIADGTLEIIDLKYGKGIPVSAEGNPQIRLYGLGALNLFGMLYDVDRVRMTIVQPRLDSLSSDELTVDELLAWGDETVKPVAEQAIRGEGEYAPGDHCQFCRAKATCRARAEANLELARYEFQAPALLSNDEVAAILFKAQELQKWACDMQDYALDQAEHHGVKFPDWKLVEGRSNRKYTDEGAVEARLVGEGYDPDAVTPRKLLGISAMEKEIGKKRFNELLSKLVIKPNGKPTLVPESDPRPELSSTSAAQADFEQPLTYEEHVRSLNIGFGG